MFRYEKLKNIGYNNAGEPATYSYYTPDSLSIVTKPRYFTSQMSELRAGDVIFVTHAAGSSTCIMISDTSAESLHDDNIVRITSPYQFEEPPIGGKVYRLNDAIDFTDTDISVIIPQETIIFDGISAEIAGFVCSNDNYELFKSPAGGSGTLNGSGLFVNVSGTNSKVFNLTDATGNNAVEFDSINFNGCTSLGVIDGYRQGLERNTGRFDGTPELTLEGTWLGGYRISTSIVRRLSNIDSLFKAGASLSMQGRFITDINVDLPAVGALIDFSESNFPNDETLIIDGAFVTRQGVLDTSDSTIYPNINHESVKSNWNNNTGVPNTRKYLKAECSVEAVTNIVLQNTYYPIAGTITVLNSAQWDMPVNGQYRLLTQGARHAIVGTVYIKGTQGDLIDVAVTLSTDNGATFPTQISHIRLELPNLAGSDDFSVYTINFDEFINKGDRVRLEVENITSTNNVTMLASSFITLREA